MPYFLWQGIDLSGSVHSGLRFAKNKNELESDLLKDGVGLMEAIRPARLTYIPLNRQEKIDFFRQCGVLLDSGVSLPQTLRVLAKQTKHKNLREALSDIYRDVYEGELLSCALKRYPDLFSGSMISIIQAGQDSGNLAQAFTKLAQYLESVELLRKKIRSATLMPLITFVAFLVIALVIFVVIMPSFSTILQSTGQKMTGITQKIFALSAYLKTQRALWDLFAVGFTIAIIGLFLKTKRGRPIAEWLQIYSPFIGPINRDSSLSYYLQTVSFLLQGGVHLVPALEIGQKTVTNSVLKKQYQKIFTAVQSGQTLSFAMEQNKRLFSQDMVALAMVGQESGTLGIMLARAADLLHEKVLRSIRIFSKVVQPTLLVVLGLLIACLIVAVYVPIFNLSQMVTY